MVQKNIGSNIVIESSVPGSVFPTSEKDIVFPVLVDGNKQSIQIEGALYGRVVELRGSVTVSGPVVARGDTKVSPGKGAVYMRSGLTINGSLNVESPSDFENRSLRKNLNCASTVIKGDVAVNQNIVLRNSIVFGSIRAVNCTLVNSLVLGSCITEEKLTVDSSSIGGYVSGEINFLGSCILIHAIGESRVRPLMLPSESNGAVESGKVHYYPALRGSSSIVGSTSKSNSAGSVLFLETDWVSSVVESSSEGSSDGSLLEERWILSIGGRIGDVAKISSSVLNISKMLKCGFEFEHYHPSQKQRMLDAAIEGLTDEEAWILKAVCI